jgi:hypothetical protein
MTHRVDTGRLDDAFDVFDGKVGDTDGTDLTRLS